MSRERMNDEKRRKELFSRAFALLDRADELIFAARAYHERDSKKLRIKFTWPRTDEDWL